MTGINPGVAAALSDTAAGGGGKFFPGIVPAAINEASEIMAQLNVPFRTHVQFKYDNRGMITDMITTQVTPLMLIMAAAAPAVVVSVVKIIELAAGTGKTLGTRGGDALDTAKEAAETIIDIAIKGANDAGEGVVGVFGRIWRLSQDPRVPVGVP